MLGSIRRHQPSRYILDPLTERDLDRNLVPSGQPMRGIPRTVDLFTLSVTLGPRSRIKSNCFHWAVVDLCQLVMPVDCGPAPTEISFVLRWRAIRIQIACENPRVPVQSKAHLAPPDAPI